MADSVGTSGPADASRVNRSAAFLRRALGVSLVPALAVLLGLVAGAIVMIVANALAGEGWDLLLPIQAYGAMLEGALGSMDGVVRTLVEATPLILAGLAVAVGFKAGLFNIGANGQVAIGALAAAAVGGAVAGVPPIAAIPSPSARGCCSPPSTVSSPGR